MIEDEDEDDDDLTQGSLGQDTIYTAPSYA